MADSKISGFTEDATPDADADYLVTVDATDGLNKRAKIKNVIRKGTNVWNAYPSASPTNVTGDGTAYQVLYDTERQARSFVTLTGASGLATINEAGTYFVEAGVRLTGGVGEDWAETHISINGVETINVALEFANEPVFIAHVCSIFDLAVNDTVAIKARAGGGALDMDIAGGNTAQNFFKITKL